MASIHLPVDSPNYSIRFRYRGRNYNRSLGTSNRAQAKSTLARVTETLWLIENGRIEPPLDADPVEFIIAGGRSTPKAERLAPLGLREFFALYQERLPDGRKEETTLKGERIHVGHLKKQLGPNRVVQSIAKADLQEYVNKRLKQRHHGRTIRPDTVRKELVTLRMLWNWGVEEGLLRGPSPTKHVILPLTDEKPPFMTRMEIERIVNRGGLLEEEVEQLWEAVYLERDEISHVLEEVRAKSLHGFIYPMVVFVAHTGARRSEMIRSRIDDVDFRGRAVMIREKKKSRSKATTYRRVDMSPLLERIMKDWLRVHPGGQFTFAQKSLSGEAQPLTLWQAQHHLKQTLGKTDWSFLRGFHVFRHSFASNLAAAGVDQRVIDEFMGHQTEEMRRRYRHLFPGQRRAAIEAAYGAA